MLIVTDYMNLMRCLLLLYDELMSLGHEGTTRATLTVTEPVLRLRLSEL
jgi:hypothetical protein